jgi:Glyoxalase-like domain
MNGGRVRLRQAVMVARELEPVAAQLRKELGLGEPFRDPGVAAFGLENVVFAIGDCFLEVVSPVREGTAAGRHLDRHGDDGGYMLLFDLEDLDSARERAEGLGVRVVWRLDLPDISGTHLHPADLRGAIVSIDASRPYGTWRWGGPDWTGRTGAGAPGRLAGVTIAVATPEAVAARWARVLGVPVADGEEPVLALEDAYVRFRAHDGQLDPGLVEIALEVPADRRAGREDVTIAGVRLRLLEGAAAAASRATQGA